jgi:hypothetical protein
VNLPMRPPLRLALDEQDQLLRLAQFRATYPGVIVEAGEFGTWQARISEENSETVITRHTLRGLLDKLDSVTAQDDGPYRRE